MTRRISISLLLLFIAASAFATNVRGLVYASDGRTPYPSVAVTLLNAKGTGPTVYTDHRGMFNVPSVAPGSYNLRVTTPRTTRTFSNIRVESKNYADLAPVSVP
jgi:hypothetical protein